MSQAVSLGRLCGPKTRGALISTLAAIALIGCGGGGGGGSSFPTADEHGNFAAEATLITPDGRNFSGQINHPTDEDWFKFRGIQGVTYVLQVSGFPRDPNVPEEFDLNGDGNFNLTARIINFDGGTQLANSTGTAGGTRNDIDPAGVEESPFGFVTGDSRIVWVCPTTNDYFIQVQHSREQTGIGAYVLRVATSQLAVVVPEDTISQTGGNDFFIFDDNGVWFVGIITGLANIRFFESEEGEAFDFGFEFGLSEAVFQPDAKEPEDWVIHFHLGSPNNFFPSNSFNATDGDPPHPSFGEIPIDVFIIGDGGRSLDASVQFPDGTVARVPVTIEEVTPIGETGLRGRGTLRFSDAIAETRGETAELSEQQLRTFIGFPWYWDIHPITDMEVNSNPAATSRPQSDIYQTFESDFVMTPGNVLRDDGTPLPEEVARGIPAFEIQYDSSLKLFQVATQQYDVLVTPFDPPPVQILNPDYAPFVGDRVRVHSGGPNETGSVLIDLGTLPLIVPPPTGVPDFEHITTFEEPGFRAPIRQLTDAEVQTLRNAHYGDGFYVQVSDAFTGQPLVRANSTEMEISFFDTAEPCMFPPCNPGRGDSPGVMDRGTVNFATTRDAGDITVWVNGEIIGLLNEQVSKDNLPACGIVGGGATVATEIWPENYYWHALAEDGTTWDGHVNITTDGCETILLE